MAPLGAFLTSLYLETEQNDTAVVSKSRPNWVICGLKQGQATVELAKNFSLVGRQGQP